MTHKAKDHGCRSMWLVMIGRPSGGPLIGWLDSIALFRMPQWVPRPTQYMALCGRPQGCNHNKHWGGHVTPIFQSVVSCPIIFFFFFQWAIVRLAISSSIWSLHQFWTFSYILALPANCHTLTQWRNKKPFKFLFSGFKGVAGDIQLTVSFRNVTCFLDFSL